MAALPERLLRLSIAHYKKPNISDEAFHRWATEEHCVRAAAIHAKHGVRTFDMVSAFSGTLLFESLFALGVPITSHLGSAVLSIFVQESMWVGLL